MNETLAFYRGRTNQLKNPKKTSFAKNLHFTSRDICATKHIKTYILHFVVLSITDPILTFRLAQFI